GHIIIGVEEGNSTSSRLWTPVGISSKDIATYDQDEIADFVAVYADPYARFSVELVELEKKNFLVFSVAGFDQYPVICKKSYDAYLEQSAVYVRPESGRPRTEKISTYKEMRDLLDLATEKGVQRFLKMQARIGSAGPSDADLFDAQLG